MAIPRFTEENYGSLILIEYIATWKVSAFNRLTASSITDAGVVLKPGYDWESIYCSIDTMGHRQTQQNDVHGDKWIHSVIGFIPGDEAATEAGLLDLASFPRYLVRITTPRGARKIVGTYTHPLTIELDSNSQNTVPGTPGTAIQFSGITLNRALLIAEGM